ncbi:uncharacterized protein LOC144004517 [Festucalex cinctus]
MSPLVPGQRAPRIPVEARGTRAEVLPPRSPFVGGRKQSEPEVGKGQKQDKKLPRASRGAASAAAASGGEVGGDSPAGGSGESPRRLSPPVFQIVSPRTARRQRRVKVERLRQSAVKLECQITSAAILLPLGLECRGEDENPGRILVLNERGGGGGGAGLTTGAWYEVIWRSAPTCPADGAVGRVSSVLVCVLFPLQVSDLASASMFFMCACLPSPWPAGRCHHGRILFVISAAVRRSDSAS